MIIKSIQKALVWLVPVECFQDKRFWWLMLFPLTVLGFLAVILYGIYDGFWGDTRLTGIIVGGGGRNEVSISNRLMVLLVTIILPMALFIRLLDREHDKPFVMRHRLKPYVITIMLMLGVLLTGRHGIGPVACLLAILSMLTSFFVLVPYRAFVKRMRQYKLPALLAVIAALSPAMYMMFAELVWERLYGATVFSLRMILSLFDIQAWAGFKGGIGVLMSNTFAMNIYPECSGIEGVFLLLYLFSLFLLIDWKLFAGRSLLEWYIIGIFYMLAVNVLRMASIFLYGEYLLKHETKKEVVEKTMDMFHSNVGFVFDTIAIALFIWCLYTWIAHTNTSAEER
jgi:exosortase/archaeosortase family protein